MRYLGVVLASGLILIGSGNAQTLASDVSSSVSVLSFVGDEVYQVGQMDESIESDWDDAFMLALEHRDDFGYP